MTDWMIGWDTLSKMAAVLTELENTWSGARKGEKNREREEGRERERERLLVTVYAKCWQQG